MARQAGYYEWDDDLTPGRKKEGGWHQNLYDENGLLKGSARFVPTEETEDEPTIITETVYVTVEERRKSRAQEELEQFASDILTQLIEYGIEAAKPHVKRWLRETAMSYAKSKVQNSRFARRQSQCCTTKAPASSAQAAIFTESPSDASSTDIATTNERPLMSSAEAQARLLAAVAARAYSDEQLAIVTSSQIIGADDVDTVRMALARLPREQVSALIKHMASNPQLLEDANLADLASLLGGFHQVDSKSTGKQEP